ncbi:MAG: hypothetical protein LUI87_16165 [Lachnospiraceae bacterium]|nr:hypothetical protein [Lachnospiraceae bacterium]
MALTEMDLMMLPEWVGCSRTSKSFYLWLIKCCRRDLHLCGYQLHPVWNRGFCFLFLKSGPSQETGRLPKLMCIFNAGTFALSDVSSLMCRLLQLPDTMELESKAHAEKTLICEINRRLLFDLEHRHELFFVLGRGIIPKLSRAEIHEDALWMIENGIPIDEVRYIPDIHFGGDTVEFTWRLYLHYLNNPAAVTDAMEKFWIQKFGEEMFQEKIRFSGIREEYALIMEKKSRK